MALLNQYRKINTSRGTYYVSWCPGDVTCLIQSEQLEPTELFPCNARQRHHFIRELYLLACRASVDVMNRESANHRVLARYAHELRLVYRK